MVDIKWCESPNALDCLADGEWDLMVAYIKHSAVTDFTIYGTEGTCVDTGQAFKFSQAGVLSMMYGGADADDDMIIYANSNDTYPFIKLNGNGNVDISVADEDEIIFYENGVQMHMFREHLGESCICGKATTGGDLHIHANCFDTYPAIHFIGDGDIHLHAKADVLFYNELEVAFKFAHAAALSTISGSDDTGDALKIIANSTDTYPFIQLEGDDYIELDTTNYIYFKEQGEQTFLFDHATPTSYMYGSDDTGDDLIILANTADDCPSISLFGDAGIKFEIKATSVFEVSTCADEILFEIDSSAGNLHMDFHCLDAHNFVLENRTDDPGSPCTGQIWFRTDLV